ncbi:saccharopine dehydrogenase family protein [Paenibacillus donghaensis]|uniref:Saccharopine dehydrogenase n=1 Tax=Paenibacillus donghaensis TaxID=414771 RepID=A0A2Z2KGV1_9BACL|nr:saccharopine dehydrogenase NADP-binding domain-containing protein [Paenibacillus donghaensis]ASA21389.1 saccharopine dehydrogenase [Paenibacillus donghaensis]
MRTDIVVIGGYGHVGSQICTLLADLYPGVVYAAGRSLARAEQFCKGSEGRIKPMQIDVSAALSVDKLRKVKLVVMCLDQSDTSFAEACLIQGIHYMDVTANLDFYRQMKQLTSSGNTYAASAVLSVGLAPGLTNLLAGEARRSMDETWQLDISVLLGLGDSHGQAAIEWTVDNLNAEYEVMQSGRSHRVKSFTDGQTIDWGQSLGRRRAYRFPFSDQLTLPDTLGIATASTRLCFDSRIATYGLALLQKLGLLRWLERSRIRNAAVRSFGRVRWGTDKYAIKVEATGLRNGAKAKAEYVIQGSKESTITAQVAAAIAGILFKEWSGSPGVYHVEQLFGLQLGEHQISLYLRGDADRLSEASNPIGGLNCWSRIS